MAIIGLIHAVPQESSALIRALPSGERSYVQGLKTRTILLGHNRIILMESGIGKSRSRMAAQTLIESARPDLIISFGFCGALSAGLNVGDLVVAEEIHLLTEADTLRTTYLPHEEMVAATTTHDCCLCGNFISTVTAVTKEHVLSKLPTGMKHPVLEMESAFVGEVCRDKGTRFAAIRAVSDSASEDPCHTFTAISTDDFSITAKSITTGVLRTPRIIPHLFHLARNASIAGRALAGPLRDIIESAP